MKAFRWIETALLALCVSFTACGGDDEPGPGEGGNGEVRHGRIARIDYVLYDDEHSASDPYNPRDTWVFTYDDEGRLIAWGDEFYPNIITYTWTDDAVTAAYNNDNRTYTLHLENGRVTETTYPSNSFTSTGWHNATFSYDASGHLTAVQFKNGRPAINFTWEDGKPTERIKNNGFNVYHYDYERNTSWAKGYMPPAYIFDKEARSGANAIEYFAYAHPEMMGLKSSMAPDWEYTYHGNSRDTPRAFFYSTYFSGNQEDYPEKITIYDNSGSNLDPTPITQYTFTWE